MSTSSLHPWVAALGAVLLTTACAADRTVAPAEPEAAVVATSALLAAVDDAQTRLLPTLAPALRTTVGGALVELRLALDAGQPTRCRRAVVGLRAALAEVAVRAAVTDTEGAEAAADLSAIEMLAGAAEAEVRPTAPGQPAPAR